VNVYRALTFDAVVLGCLKDAQERLSGIDDELNSLRSSLQEARMNEKLYTERYTCLLKGNVSEQVEERYASVAHY